MSASASAEAPSASFRRIRLSVHTERGAIDVNAIASLPLFRVLEWVQREQEQLLSASTGAKLNGGVAWTDRNVTTPLGSALDIRSTLDELRLGDGDEIYWLGGSHNRAGAETGRGSAASGTARRGDLGDHRARSSDAFLGILLLAALVAVGKLGVVNEVASVLMSVVCFGFVVSVANRVRSTAAALALGATACLFGSIAISDVLDAARLPYQAQVPALCGVCALGLGIIGTWHKRLAENAWSFIAFGLPCAVSVALALCHLPTRGAGPLLGLCVALCVLDLAPWIAARRSVLMDVDLIDVTGTESEATFERVRTMVTGIRAGASLSIPALAIALGAGAPTARTVVATLGLVMAASVLVLAHRPDFDDIVLPSLLVGLGCVLYGAVVSDPLISAAAVGVFAFLGFLTLLYRAHPPKLRPLRLMIAGQWMRRLLVVASIPMALYASGLLTSAWGAYSAWHH